MIQENLALEEPTAEPEYWYRYTDRYYRNSELGPTEARINLEKFRVIKRTPCGVNLDVGGKTRFVMEHGTKAFARPCKDRAFTDFKARKRRQRMHLNIQLGNVELAIELAEKGRPVEKVYKRGELRPIL